MPPSRACWFLCMSILAAFSSTLLSGALRNTQSPAAATPSGDFKATSVSVYVAPFDINLGAGASAPASAAAPANPAAKKPPESTQPESTFVLKDADSPSLQVIQLRKFFGDTLIQALQKNGYSAKLQTGSRPEKGLLIRGVFAEVDSRSRNCLALLGGAAPSTDFQLYVGLHNLARPDQPLYQAVQTESCDPRFGPLITLNTYIPMNKYEVSKDPTEEEVRKVCDRIASNLTALLNANAAAFAQ
jgi:hypothetical protein